MTGKPYLIRLVSGLRTPEEPCSRTRRCRHGRYYRRSRDQVQARRRGFGISKGSFAEYAPARQDKLVSKPANLSLEQAAAVAVSGLTALQGLRDAGHLQQASTC